MPSANGQKQTVVLYARVSTDEQAKSSYSIPDQLGTLRDYADRQGYEVLEECVDDGWSGADPDRPGIRRVMELAEAGAVDVVVAVKRDRFFRSRLYRLLMDRDLQECGVKLEALNDTGNRIGDGVQDDFAEWEREQITERTMRGKLEKARQGKVIAGRIPDYGFRFGPERGYYEVVEEEMAVVWRIFSELASGTSVNGVCAALDADGVLPPAKGKKWQRTFVRDCAFDDVYAPHTVEELGALGVSPEVLGKLDATRPYGIWWYNRRESRAVRVSLGGGRYRKGKQTRKRHFHYACGTRRQRGKEACSYSRTPNARKIEVEVWEAVKGVLLHPERLERGLNAYLESEEKKAGGTPRRRLGHSRT